MPPDRALAFDRLLSALLIGGALVAALAIESSYLLRLLAIAGCYAILTIGYQRIFGALGVLSLAQGAFFAIGGYAAAIIGIGTGLDGLLLLPLATLLAVLTAVIVAPPMLKLASHYFALASLAVAQLVLLAAINLESLTGGSNGISGLQTLRLGGIAISPGTALTVTIWVIVCLSAAAFWWPGALAMLRRHVLRDAPLAAQAIGINPARWRIMGFAFSAACAGMAGALYVQATGVVAPDIAEFAVMINVLAMSVIGGRGRVSGAVIGALILAFMPEALRFLGGWQLFAWGATMLLMLIVAPGGIAGLLERLYSPQTATSSAPASSGKFQASDGALQATALRKTFGGVTAVDNLFFALKPGEIVGVIGANGAGKTTLLNLLSGFEAVDAGRIEWRAMDITKRPVHERARLGIGRSFQIDQLPGDLTAIDAIAAATPNVRNLEQARRDAMAVAGRLGLAPETQKLLSDLAPATRRLVDIARALAARPSLLLLDEPTSGLNVDERAALSETFRGLRDDGIGLLLVEHDIGFILSLADRILCLEQGRLVAEGTVADLATRSDLQRFFGRKGAAA